MFSYEHLALGQAADVGLRNSCYASFSQIMSVLSDDRIPASLQSAYVRVLRNLYVEDSELLETDGQNRLHHHIEIIQ